MAETNQRSGAAAQEPRRYQNYVIVGVFVMLVPLTMALLQYKIPTIMMPLMEMFQTDAAGGSWLMSIFLLMAAIFSIPVSLLCQKIGPFKVTLCATLIAVAGSVLGAFAPTYEVLLFSRALEGIGECATAVVGPIIIESCVNPQRVGTAMGIWAVWGSLGATVAAVLTPAVFNSLGQPVLWMLDAAFVVLSTILMFVMVKDPSRYNKGLRTGGARDVLSVRSGAGKGGADSAVAGAGAGAPAPGRAAAISRLRADAVL